MMNARARLNRAQLRQFKFNGNAKESVDAQDVSSYSLFCSFSLTPFTHLN